MDKPKSPLAMVAYFILGLIVIGVGIRVIGWMISLALNLIAVAISVAVVIAVGYLAYLFIRALIRSSS